MKTSMSMIFQAYGGTLEVVLEFKYLGRVLTASYDVCLEVVGKLMKLQKWWARMSMILGQEVEDSRTPRKFYKAVVQATLLFGAETWVMSPLDWEDPGRFSLQGGM